MRGSEPGSAVIGVKRVANAIVVLHTLKEELQEGRDRKGLDQRCFLL